MISRTAEKVLIVFAQVLVLIGLSISLILSVGANTMAQDPSLYDQVTDSLLHDSSNGLTVAEFEFLYEWILQNDTYFFIFAGMMVISFVLSIIAYRQLPTDRPAKSATKWLIGSGFFAGIILLPSILLYVAAVFAYAKEVEIAEK